MSEPRHTSIGMPGYARCSTGGNIHPVGPDYDCRERARLEADYMRCRGYVHCAECVSELGAGVESACRRCEAGLHRRCEVHRA